MRIEDVIALAGVSRRTFYDHFANKEEAFLAAYELVLEQLLSGVTSAFASGESWTSRVRRGLAAFLNLLASEPVLAQVCVVEALAAGPRALARRTEAMAAFQALLVPPKGDALATSTAPPVAVEAIVGGIYEVIYSRVTSNRTEELPSLLPSLLHSALLPFVGAEVADAEYERTTRTAAERAIPAP
jgi:AcrR family transcriptional regulator